MNVILAAAAMNFKRRINLWHTEALRRWLLILKYLFDTYWNFITQNAKMTF